MCKMIHPLLSAYHSKIAEVYDHLKKILTSDLVGNGVPMKSVL
jgi:hypothetical protein